MQRLCVNSSRAVCKEGHDGTPELPGRRTRRGAPTPPMASANLNRPLRPLAPYKRCVCGVCRVCLENAKWDRIFAKFEVKQDADGGGFCRSPIADF